MRNATFVFECCFEFCFGFLRRLWLSRIPRQLNAPGAINKHPRPDPTNGLSDARFTPVDVDLPIPFPRDRPHFPKALTQREHKYRKRRQTTKLTSHQSLTASYAWTLSLPTPLTTNFLFLGLTRLRLAYPRLARDPILITGCEGSEDSEWEVS